MNLRFLIIFLSLFFAKTLSGQFLYYSVNLFLPISANIVRIDNDLIFSKKSNAVYINDHKNQFSITPLGSIGVGVGTELRKMFIQIDANIRYYEFNYKVRYPLGANLDKEYIGNMSSFNFDVPLVFGTTFLNSSKMRPYIELGIVYGYDLTGHSENRKETSTIYETDLYKGHLYSGSRSNLSGLAGIGFKSGLLFMTLKYNHRMTGLTKGSLSSYFSINFKIVISNKEKSKKNYIHFEN